MAGAISEQSMRGDESPDQPAPSPFPSTPGPMNTESVVDGSEQVTSRNPMDLILRLPGVSRIAARIGMPELRRRLLHMLPGLLPFVLWVYPHERMWELPVRVWVVGLVMLVVTFGMRSFGSMLRPGESGASSVLNYGFCVLGALAIAPNHPEFMLIVVVLLAFGDGSATLGGMLIGGPRLFWNRDKTWSGLMCFFVAGTVTSAVVYWGEVDVSWRDAFVLGAAVALCAALAESLPVRLDDNLRVGFASLTACFVYVDQYELLIMMCVASVVGFFVSRKFPIPSQNS